MIDTTENLGPIKLPVMPEPDMARYVVQQVIPAALQLMPKSFRGARAELMLAAIGMQESGLAVRAQRLRGRSEPGPARGFWQFEPVGVVGVLKWNRGKFLPVIKDSITPLLAREADREGYLTPERLYRTLEHVDLIACIVARCLLYTHQDMLPKPGDAEKAWEQYIDTWRPGKPSRERWTTAYDTAYKLWSSQPV